MYLTRSEKESLEYNLSFDSDKIGLVIGICVAMGVVGFIQWAIMHFFHLIYAVSLSGFTAFLLSTLYIGLKHASPNGGNYRIYNIEYFLPGLLIFSLLLLNLAGVYIVEQRLITGVWNVLYRNVFLVVLIGLPLVYFVGLFVYSYTCLYLFAKNYVYASISLQHLSQLPIQVDEFKFVNTKNRSEVRFQVGQSKEFYLPETFLNQTIINRNSKAISTIFNSEIYSVIPQNSDRIYISWFSPIEGKYYSEDYVFDFSECNVKNNHYHGLALFLFPEKRIDSMKILILKDGKVDLYISNLRRLFYKKSSEKILSALEIRAKKLEFRSLFSKKMDDELILAKMEEINHSEALAQQLERRLSTFQWNLMITGLGDIRYAVSIQDVAGNSYSRSTAYFEKVDLRSLPCFLGIYQDKNYDVYFDTEKLYAAFQTLIKGNLELPIEILIQVKDIDLSILTIALKSLHTTVEFLGWELLKK